MIKKILITALLFISGVSLAQKHELGVFIGGSGYLGDIGDDQIGEVLSHQSPAIGFIHKVNLHEHLSLRSSIQTGLIKGSDFSSKDPNQQARNLSFQSKIFDFSMGLEFNFYEFTVRRHEISYSPFVFAGFSFFSFNPQAKNKQGKWVDLQSIGTEGQGTLTSNKGKYDLTSWAIPFGLGYKANVGDKLGLSIEWTWRATKTDYLDDVSSYYPDPKHLTEEAVEFSNPGSIDDVVGKTRGNPNLNDWYNFTGITITYKITNKLKQCPRALQL